TPPSPTIPQNTAQQFTATGSFTDGSTQDLTATATWNSSPTSVATISNSSGSEGLATGIGGGTSSITAQYMVSTSTTITSPADVLTVTPRTLQSIAVTPNPATLNAGQQQQFTATGTYNAAPMTQDVTASAAWTSDNTAVATVNMSTGLASALAGGTANITATVGPKQGSAVLNVNNPSLLNISVAPQNATIRLDFTQQYTATGNYSDGSTQDLSDVVVWSEATGVGSIDPTGLYTPSSPGPDTVTAACSGACLPSGQTGNVSASADLTVTF
ncbi:MAG TPA: Ig-like domain-containing protein, partial [Terriglobales bacterium]|nr:Ig-like domain-containing protein [Terriglobales bacterium]